MTSVLERYEALQREQERWHRILATSERPTELEKMTGTVDEARVARYHRALAELERIGRELAELRPRVERYEELEHEQQHWQEILHHTARPTALEQMTGQIDEARVAQHRRAMLELERIHRELAEIRHHLEDETAAS
ncbi:MAG: hypothetical protein C4289_12600 [Chloroflexota bacterium]